MHISNLALKPVSSNDAFTTVNVQYSNPRVSGPLHLKIDTGSGGNTLPMRTYHQMFGNRPTHFILTAETDTKLTSYSGHHIKCYGSINLKLSKGNEEYQQHKFYVVEVPGPAILGLPSCKDLKVIVLDPDSTTYKHDLPSSVQYDELRATHLSKCVTFNNISDVKWCFP